MKNQMNKNAFIMHKRPLQAAFFSENGAFRRSLIRKRSGDDEARKYRVNICHKGQNHDIYGMNGPYLRYGKVISEYHELYNRTIVYI
jgi:hypothetical protein